MSEAFGATLGRLPQSDDEGQQQARTTGDYAPVPCRVGIWECRSPWTATSTTWKWNPAPRFFATSSIEER